ncbi:MAG: hypothetical protein L0287_15295, partial [Anaerolineae bacterium]|nr:hypothetical protein [Anaerolineae bacterium]
MIRKTSITAATLLFALILPALTWAGPIDNRADKCGFDTVDITTEVGSIFNNRIAEVLDEIFGRRSGFLTGLLAGLILIAIFSMVLDYYAGRLDWKGFFIRVFVTLLLLSHYNDTNNFRTIIDTSANAMAQETRYITYKGLKVDALEAVWDEIYLMYQRLQLEAGSNESGGTVRWIGSLVGLDQLIDAGAAIEFIFSPA